MPSLTQLIFSMLLPAIVCGGFYTVVAYLWKRDVNQTVLQWLIAAALGVGYIIGYIGLEGKLTIIPIESRHWIFYLAIVAIGSSSYWHLSKLRSLISQIFYSILIPRILLNSYYEFIWNTYEGIIWWIGLSIAIFLFFRFVQESFRTLPSNATIPFVYLGISCGTALILALSGSMLLALHSIILVSLLAVIWGLTIILPRILKFDSVNDFVALQISITPVLAILLIGIWLNGRFYAEVPSASALFLVIAPLFALVTRLPVIQKLNEQKAVFLQVGLIALCVCIAISIALVRSGFFGENAY